MDVLEANATRSLLDAIAASVFVDGIVLTVPSPADRYGYKKVGGSSDTKVTYDALS